MILGIKSAIERLAAGMLTVATTLEYRMSKDKPVRNCAKDVEERYERHLNHIRED